MKICHAEFLAQDGLARCAAHRPLFVAGRYCQLTRPQSVQKGKRHEYINSRQSAHQLNVKSHQQRVADKSEIVQFVDAIELAMQKINCHFISYLGLMAIPFPAASGH